MRSSSCRPDRPTARSLAAEEAPAVSNLETTARIVANATAEMKPANMLPPTALAKWDSQPVGAPPNASVACAYSRPARTYLRRIFAIESLDARQSQASPSNAFSG